MKRLLFVVVAALIAALAIAIEAPNLPHQSPWEIVEVATAAVMLPAAGGAFTIREFCKAHNISPAFYYVMRNKGWGPAEMHAGQRVLISYESAATWRRAREAAAAAGMRRAPDKAQSKKVKKVSPDADGVG